MPKESRRGSRLADAFVADEGVAQPGLVGLRFARRFAPLIGVALGKVRVARVVGVDLGEVEPVGQR